MSYSTWKGGSRWFTFWDVCASCEKNRETFAIAGVASFTYYQIKNDLFGCLNKIRTLVPDVKQKEIEELEGYMHEFTAEIDRHHERGHHKL